MKWRIFLLVPLLLTLAGCEAVTPSTNSSTNTVNSNVTRNVNSNAVIQTNVKTAPIVNTTTQDPAPNGYYINTYGNEVPRPYYAPSVPAGASARCGDGTYSFSQSRRGTCSHHSGVTEWY